MHCDPALHPTEQGSLFFDGDQVRTNSFQKKQDTGSAAFSFAKTIRLCFDASFDCAHKSPRAEEVWDFPLWMAVLIINLRFAEHCET